MKARTTPRTIPADSKHHFAVEFGTKGEHHFRLPFPVYVLEVLALIEERGLYRFKARGETGSQAAPGDADGGDGDEGILPPRAVMRESLALWSLGGASIGLCWFHRDIDLEATLDGHGGDYEKFGRAVLEELHDAGYEPGDLRISFPDVISRLTRSVIGAKVVSDRADFSGPQEDSST